MLASWLSNPQLKESTLIHTLLKSAALCSTLAALAGCAVSPIPLSQDFQTTSQQKVRAAGHWSQVSQDVVDQTAATLLKSGATLESTIHVPMPANASDFDRAFHEFLITGLVQKGWHVLVPANNINPVLTLNYQTQIVRHSYGYGVNISEPGLTEMVLTTTVTNAGRYISRKTDVYYVEGIDRFLFAGPYSNPAMLNAKSMKVVSQ